tara:strand:+ start:95 stop:610 length:516 start_codon:yes stop_codon:yes gene_type:complete
MLLNLYLKILRKIILLLRNSPFNLSIKLRYSVYKYLMKSIGKQCNILDCVVINQPEKVSLGERVSIHQFCYFDSQGDIEIGNNVAIGNHVKLLTSDHIFNNKKDLIKDQGVETKKIIIKDNVWIGAGVTILKGVVVGENSIIGAQSLVNKNVPPNVIAAGVPCKVIKERQE